MKLTVLREPQAARTETMISDMVGRENLACRDKEAQFNKKDLSYHLKAEEKMDIKRFHATTGMKYL